MQTSDLKIHALTHYVSKKVSAQGLYYILTTGRLTIEQENKIAATVGDQYFHKEMMHMLQSKLFECNPNPEVANNKKIIKLADELADVVGVHKLYRLN